MRNDGMVTLDNCDTLFDFDTTGRLIAFSFPYLENEPDRVLKVLANTYMRAWNDALDFVWETEGEQP